MIFFKKFKITGQILFVTVLIFFSTLQARNLEKFERAGNIADYFSGVILLNESKYKDSYKYLKKLDGLEQSHLAYSSKYLLSLVNSGNLVQAVNFSKKLEKENKSSFESNLILGIFYLKNYKNETAKKYFSKAQKINLKTILDNYLVSSLYILTEINDGLDTTSINSIQLDSRFKNLNKIQNVFLNCFISSNKTETLFRELTSDQDVDFSRYNYFYAKYLFDKGNESKAKMIVNNSLKKYPRNLLLNQFKKDLQNSKNNFNFNCKKKEHIAAELLYISANALSSQSIYSSSNFYLNLSKYLNQDFHSFDTLLAENFFKNEDFESAKVIYKKLANHGSAFKWFSDKQIARILILEEKKTDALSLLNISSNNLKFKEVYETFDFAEFLKNNQEFKTSIKYYTETLNKINSNHPLYPEVLDGRGVAYENIDEWDMAEKDLLESLKVNPDQAYVINYLAYSWIEQGIKIEKSLKMLEKANNLKSNDPYIIDSLGWALFKLKRYNESKDYLQLAVKLMPADPIVNDHYGDVLWKNGKELQARYYWNYVLNLDKTDEDLKKNIEKKLIKGL